MFIQTEATPNPATLKFLPGREVMVWEIMRLLPEMVDRAEFRPLKHYLGGEADLRKRYQLASQIANLFDQYLVFRPDLVLAWDEGQGNRETVTYYFFLEGDPPELHECNGVEKQNHPKKENNNEEGPPAPGNVTGFVSDRGLPGRPGRAHVRGLRGPHPDAHHRSQPASHDRTGPRRLPPPTS